MAGGFLMPPPSLWNVADDSVSGTHFSCFTGTRVQILTQRWPIHTDSVADDSNRGNLLALLVQK